MNFQKKIVLLFLNINIIHTSFNNAKIKKKKSQTYKQKILIQNYLGLGIYQDVKKYMKDAEVQVWKKPQRVAVHLFTDSAHHFPFVTWLCDFWGVFTMIGSRIGSANKDARETVVVTPVQGSQGTNCNQWPWPVFFDALLIVNYFNNLNKNLDVTA